MSSDTVIVICPFCKADVTPEVERAVVCAFRSAESAEGGTEVPVACPSCRGALGVEIVAKIVLTHAEIVTSTPPAKKQPVNIVEAITTEEDA